MAIAGAFLLGLVSWRSAIDEAGSVEALRDAAPKKQKGVKAAVAATSTTIAPTTTSRPPDARIILPVSAEASSTAEPAQNGCGQPVNYAASQMIDGSVETAWRAVGDGRGVKLTVVLPTPTKLTDVGLLPGYDKRDQCTGVDRFVQLRRVTMVRWTFDDGTSIEQTFTNARQVQSVPVSSTTTRVIVEILTASPPGELDYVAVSELTVTGIAS